MQKVLLLAWFQKGLANLVNGPFSLKTLKLLICPINWAAIETLCLWVPLNLSKNSLALLPILLATIFSGFTIVVPKLTLKVDFIVLSEEEANRLWRIEPDVLFPQIIDDRILDKTKLGQICLVLQFFLSQMFLVFPHSRELFPSISDSCRMENKSLLAAWKSYYVNRNPFSPFTRLLLAISSRISREKS